jgi:hypothetical protein
MPIGDRIEKLTTANPDLIHDPQTALDFAQSSLPDHEILKLAEDQHGMQVIQWRVQDLQSKPEGDQWEQWKMLDTDQQELFKKFGYVPKPYQDKSILRKVTKFAGAVGNVIDPTNIVEETVSDTFHALDRFSQETTHLYRFVTDMVTSEDDVSSWSDARRQWKATADGESYWREGVKEKLLSGVPKEYSDIVESMAEGQTAGEYLEERGYSRNSPEWDQEMLKVQGALIDPDIANHIARLTNAKVSPGRDLLALAGGRQNQFLAGNIPGTSLNAADALSGAVDGAWRWMADPTLMAGKINKAYKLGKYGISGLSKVGMIDDIERMRAAYHAGGTAMHGAGRAGIGAERIAEGFRSGDMAKLIREMPGIQHSIRDMEVFHRAGRAITGDRGMDTVDGVFDFFVSGAGIETITAGRFGTRAFNHAGIHALPMASGRRVAIGGIKDVIEKGIDKGRFAGTGFEERMAGLTLDMNTPLAKRIGATASLGVWQPVRVGAEAIHHMTNMIPKELFINPNKPESVEIMRQVLAFHMPKGFRDDMLNEFILRSPNISFKKMLSDKVLMDSAEAAGLLAHDKGRNFIERYVARRNHSYAAMNLDHRTLSNGMEVRAGIWPNQLSNAWGLPGFRDQLTAAKNLGHYTEMTQNAVDTVMSQMWKPSVLLRVGFIPRAFGEEILWTLGQYGAKRYARGMGTLIGSRDLDEPLAIMRPLVRASRGLRRIAPGIAKYPMSALDVTAQAAFKTMSRGVRGIARSTTPVEDFANLRHFAEFQGSLGHALAESVSATNVTGLATPHINSDNLMHVLKPVPGQDPMKIVLRQEGMEDVENIFKTMDVGHTLMGLMRKMEQLGEHDQGQILVDMFRKVLKPDELQQISGEAYRLGLIDNLDDFDSLRTLVPDDMPAIWDNYLSQNIAENVHGGEAQSAANVLTRHEQVVEAHEKVREALIQSRMKAQTRLARLEPADVSTREFETIAGRVPLAEVAEDYSGIRYTLREQGRSEEEIENFVEQLRIRDAEAGPMGSITREPGDPFRGDFSPEDVMGFDPEEAFTVNIQAETERMRALGMDEYDIGEELDRLIAEAEEGSRASRARWPNPYEPGTPEHADYQDLIEGRRDIDEGTIEDYYENLAEERFPENRGIFDPDEYPEMQEINLEQAEWWVANDAADDIDIVDYDNLDDELRRITGGERPDDGIIPVDDELEVTELALAPRQLASRQVAEAEADQILAFVHSLPSQQRNALFSRHGAFDRHVRSQGLADRKLVDPNFLDDDMMEELGEAIQRVADNSGIQLQGLGTGDDTYHSIVNEALGAGVDEQILADELKGLHRRWKSKGYQGMLHPIGKRATLWDNNGVAIRGVVAKGETQLRDRLYRAMSEGNEQEFRAVAREALASRAMRGDQNALWQSSDVGNGLKDSTPLAVPRPDGTARVYTVTVPRSTAEANLGFIADPAMADTDAAYLAISGTQAVDFGAQAIPEQAWFTSDYQQAKRLQEEMSQRLGASVQIGFKDITEEQFNKGRALAREGIAGGLPPDADVRQLATVFLDPADQIRIEAIASPATEVTKYGSEVRTVSSLHDEIERLRQIEPRTIVGPSSGTLRVEDVLAGNLESPAEGMVRLYRGGAANQQGMGIWYTIQPRIATSYATDVRGIDNIEYVDVSEDVAKKWFIGNTDNPLLDEAREFSTDRYTEYYIPRNLLPGGEEAADVDINDFIGYFEELRATLPEDIQEAILRYSAPGVRSQEVMRETMPRLIEYMKGDAQYKTRLNSLLDELGVGDELVVYRGGPIERGYEATNVSLSSTAAAKYGEPVAYKIPRSAIVGHGDSHAREFFVDTEDILGIKDEVKNIRSAIDNATLTHGVDQGTVFEELAETQLADALNTFSNPFKIDNEDPRDLRHVANELATKGSVSFETIDSVPVGHIPTNLSLPRMVQTTEANFLQRFTQNRFDEIGRAGNAMVRHPLFMALYSDAMKGMGALRDQLTSPDVMKKLDNLASKYGFERDAMRQAWLRLPDEVKYAANPVAVADNLSIKLPTELANITPKDAQVMTQVMNQTKYVEQQISDIAMERATRHMTPYIDDHRLRSQFQERHRHLIPFQFAEEQFLKRWARTVVDNPEVLQKAQLSMQGLKHVGYISQNEFGEDVYVFPGSELMMKAVSKMLMTITGQPIMLPMSNPFTGQVKYTFAGSDRFGIPAVGPIAGIGTTLVKSFFPEIAESQTFQMTERAVYGERGFNRNLWQQIVPTSFYAMINARAGDPEHDLRMASAMNSAAAMMEAEGLAPGPEATDKEKDIYQQRLRNHARMVEFMRGALSFVTPATASYDVPNLSREFKDLLKDMPIEEATRVFIGKHPDALPWTVFESKSVSGAPLPATDAAYKVLSDHEEYFTKYQMAGPWFLPQAKEDDPYAQQAFYQQMTFGLRVRKLPEEYQRDIDFAQAAPIYFDSKKQKDVAIEAWQAAGDKDMVREIKASWKTWKDQYFKLNPVFKEELENPESHQRREKIISQMTAAVNDPEVPNVPHLEPMKMVLTQFQGMKAALEAWTPYNTRESREARELIRENFDAWATHFVRYNPEIKAFYQRVIMYEVGGG